MQSFRDLEVWQVSLDLAVACYEATKPFPKEERYGLVSQIRRASASVPANIAEGHGRQHTKEFLHSLGIANGSLYELETHLLLCRRVQLLTAEEVGPLLVLCERVSKMIARLRQALERKLSPP
jgi:four helix bundle protein